MKISVFVKAGSRKGPLLLQTDGDFVIFVRERAVEGAANAAVTRLLATHYDIPKTRVLLVRGHTSAHKVFEVKN